MLNVDRQVQRAVNTSLLCKEALCLCRSLYLYLNSVLR